MRWTFIISVLLLFSCNQEGDEISGDWKLREYNIPTQVIPYRIIKHGENNLKNSIRRILNFSMQPRDENTITIRIWDELDNQFNDIYVLTFNKKGNSAVKYKVNYLSTDGMSLDSAAYKKIVLGNPKDGWKNFTNKVLHFDVMNIPDYTSLLSYFEDIGEMYVTLEFIKFNFYSIAEYPTPSIRKDKFYYAAKTSDLVDYVKGNF